MDFLQNVCKHILHAFKVGYHGIIHIDPNTTAAVKKIAHKVRELELNCYKPDWSENETI